MSRKTTRGFLVAAMVLACAAPTLAAGQAGTKAKGQLIERGRYLIQVGGCNDCHTAGYGEANGKVPETQWLTGSPLGWKGPWGTTYASNLRTYFQQMSADQWVKAAQTLQTRPPMPWFTLHQIKEGDLRAMHAFVSSLGPGGGPTPSYLPPGTEPPQPFVSFPAPPPGK